MADHKPNPLRNENTSYEHSDVNTRLVLGSIIMLIVVTVCSMGLSVWIYGSVQSSAEAIYPTPLPLLPLRPTPPLPRLQPNPLDGRRTAEEDLAIMHEREDAFLNDYGWVDKEGGVARIPVDRAIEILSGEPEAEEPSR
jgi:hypothetical protein